MFNTTGARATNRNPMRSLHLRNGEEKSTLSESNNIKYVIGMFIIFTSPIVKRNNKRHDRQVFVINHTFQIACGPTAVSFILNDCLRICFYLFA